MSSKQVTLLQAYKIHRTVGPPVPEKKIGSAENVQNEKKKKK